MRDHVDARSQTIEESHLDLRTRGARRNLFALFAAVFIMMALMGAGCRSSASPEASPAPGVRTVNVVMGYQQNVQFAPFYVAVKKGFYQRAGLNVSFNYQTEPNALSLLATGKTDFVDSGGDEVMTAAANGLAVTYVMTQYSRFPSALFFLKKSGIKSVSDLNGKTVGIPGKYGASYFGLLALLAQNHVPASSVNIQAIGYTQVSSVSTGKVDAAMGYATNEPIELRGQGKKVGEFDVYRWANIAGAGLATSKSMMLHKPKIVRAFVQATLRGMRFTISHPAEAFKISVRGIPGLTDLKLQRRVLDRAIDFWRPASVPLGHMDPKVWIQTLSTLNTFGQQHITRKASSFYTNQFAK